MTQTSPAPASPAAPDAASAASIPATPPLPRPGSAAEFTVRAMLTGFLLAGGLSLCNIYAGLKVGWGFNMSITAVLIAFGFWNLSQKLFGTRSYGMLENNISQTAASAGANISSAGLVSAVPAMTILTGQTLSWGVLAVWCFAVAVVGVVVGLGIRRQMIIVDKLPFPSGIATAQALKEMYSTGAEALTRVKYLAGGALVAAVVKVIQTVAKLPNYAVPGAVQYGAAGKSASLFNLTFAFEPTLMMVGVGALVGLRTGISLLLGAVIAWGVLAPELLARGWVTPGAESAAWFGPLNTWMLWPGVGMMVTSSLTSFAFSWRSIVAAIGGARKKKVAVETPVEDDGEISRKGYIRALVLVLVIATVAQIAIFGISWWLAIFAVFFTFLLAIVAGRVSGETAITPVGPMGKVTQLVVGVMSPGDPVTNLMAANVTGGAASQTGDMLHDLKTGHLIGAKARLQGLAQTFGVVGGALVGSAAYLVLIPDPKGQLLTAEWPAPAAAAWKAVAEVFSEGLHAMPPGTQVALLIAGVLGIVLALLEKLLPAKARRFVPSPASLGLAFIIPAWNAMSMFLGAILAAVAGKVAPKWSAAFIVIIAAGVVAGESLTGVLIALQKILTGG